jgi:hypothetical protein
MGGILGCFVEILLHESRPLQFTVQSLAIDSGIETE